MANATTADRIVSLDLLRGACAVVVALFHSLSSFYDIKLWSAGTFGVYTFFVLSALAMMIRYADDFRDSISLSDARGFFRNRFARIIPLLATVIGIGLIFNWIMNGDHPAGVLQLAFLAASGLFSLHMPLLIGRISVGSWSLGIELAFYAVFPIVALLAKAASTRNLVIAFVILLAGQHAVFDMLPLYTTGVFKVIPGYVHESLLNLQQYTMPLTFAPYFASGLLAFRLSYVPQSKALFWVATGLFFVMVLYSYGIGDETGASIFNGGPHHLFLTFLCIATVAAAYRARVPQIPAVIGGFFGEISYSLYLSHFIPMRLAAEFVPEPFKLIAFLAGAVALAYALTYLVERPARRWLRRR